MISLDWFYDNSPIIIGLFSLSFSLFLFYLIAREPHEIQSNRDVKS